MTYSIFITAHRYQHIHGLQILATYKIDELYLFRDLCIPMIRALKVALPKQSGYLVRALIKQESNNYSV